MSILFNGIRKIPFLVIISNDIFERHHRLTKEYPLTGEEGVYPRPKILTVYRLLTHPFILKSNISDEKLNISTCEVKKPTYLTLL